MKYPLTALYYAAVLLTSATVSNATTIRAASPLVQIEGRMMPTARLGVLLGYPGVTFHLRFRGSSLSLHAATTAEAADFDVVVDGGQATRFRLPKGEAEVVVFQGGADAEHSVELTHCTESYNGLCEIESFTSAGEFLPAPPLSDRRLLFIGDSFTAGAATEVQPGKPINPSKSSRQNARLSYGFLLARRLTAQVQIVAYAGRGLMRDWQGLKSVKCLPEIYGYALPDNPATFWSPTNYVPDVIGVCTGNDFDIGLPDEFDFVRVCSNFLRQLRQDAPRSSIFLILSPILTDAPAGIPQRTVSRAYLDEVVKHLNDPRITVVEVGAYSVVPGDGHPDGAAHQAIANRLEPYFRRALPIELPK